MNQLEYKVNEFDGLTSAGKKRSTGIVVGRRLGAQIRQDGRHVALGDTELAVLHHQVGELAHHGVVAVVFVRIAGQRQGGQAELVTDGSVSDGSASDGSGSGGSRDFLNTKVCVCDQSFFVEGVVVVLAQFLVTASVCRE